MLTRDEFSVLPLFCKVFLEIIMLNVRKTCLDSFYRFLPHLDIEGVIIVSNFKN